jgi:hypothetical protein
VQTVPVFLGSWKSYYNYFPRPDMPPMPLPMPPF